MESHVKFRIEALPAQTLQSLFTMSEPERAAHNAQLVTVEEPGSTPCRISLQDAEPGEEVILASFTHQAAHSPYHASGPIFVRRDVAQARLEPGEVPLQLKSRLISLRAYDRSDRIIQADVINGAELHEHAARFLADPAAHYLHAHFARYGCYAARIVRA